MANPVRPRIAVIGAGPIGIEAALQARKLGFPVTVFDRGDIGEHLGQWGHVKLFTPFGLNVSPLGLETIKREHPQHQLPGVQDVITGVDYRDGYLVPLSLTAALGDCIKTKSLVVRIARAGMLRSDAANDPRRSATPFRLLIRDDKGAERFEEADVILDCSGTYARHGWLGDGGIPAIGELAAEKQIAYGLEDVVGKRKNVYAGKCVIVVGGGYSAASTVCGLAQLAEENSAGWVIWLTRGPRSTPLPRNPNDVFKERDRLAARANNFAARGDGNVEFRSQTFLDEVISHGPDKGFRVTGRVAGKPMVWEVDRVIGNVGYTADEAMTKELHVGEFAGGRTMCPEPGYYVLGMKSYGRDSNFLIKQGIEQVREVMAVLQKR